MKDGTIKFIDFPIEIEDPQFNNITVLKGKEYCDDKNWWEIIYAETQEDLFGIKDAMINFLENNRMFIFIVCFGSKFKFFELTKELYTDIQNILRDKFKDGKNVFPIPSEKIQKWNSQILIDNEFTKDSDQIFNNLIEVK